MISAFGIEHDYDAIDKRLPHVKLPTLHSPGVPGIVKKPLIEARHSLAANPKVQEVWDVAREPGIPLLSHLSHPKKSGKIKDLVTDLEIGRAKGTKVPSRFGAKPRHRPERGATGLVLPKPTQGLSWGHKNELKALSKPDDAIGSIRNFGRKHAKATTEHFAEVHPLSGRVLATRTAGQGLATPPTWQEPRRAERRMMELAGQAKSPAVRVRARRDVEGRNQNLAGPRPIQVHNHPRTERLQREYPSGQDLQMRLRTPYSTGKEAVTTPRGKKTAMTFTSDAPNRVSGKHTRSGKTVKANRLYRRRFKKEVVVNDLATQPKWKHGDLDQGMLDDTPMEGLFERRQNLMASQMRLQRRLTGHRVPKNWDEWVRSKTAHPSDAVRSGVHSRQIVKRYSVFGIAH